MNILQLLKHDHDAVETLFKKMLETTPKQNEVRRALFANLKKELDIHTDVEESVFYPSLKKYKEIKDIILASYTEHELVDKLLNDIVKMNPADEHWMPTVKVLKTNVEHHVKEEENLLFPKVASLVDDETLQNMGREMQKCKIQDNRDEMAHQKRIDPVVAKNKDFVSPLNSILALLYDSYGALNELADKVSNKKLNHLFKKLSQQRQEFIEKLNKKIQSLKGEPVESGRGQSILHRLYINLKLLVTSDDTHAVGQEIKTIEQTMLNKYQEVLRDITIPKPIQEILQTQAEIIESGLTQVERLAAV